MATLRSLLVLFPITLSLASCSGGRLQSDLKQLERNVQDIRGFQAEQTNKIAALEVQVRELNGRLEELEYKQNRRIGTDLDTLRQDLSSIKSRIPPPSIVPAEILETDELRATSMPSEIASVLQPSLTNIREGKFDEAQNRLSEGLILSKATEWEADVLFWLGVANEGRNDSREALRSYVSVNGQFPKHRKAAPALLRQAAIFVKIGDSKTAKVTLKKLMADFPKSAEAAQARERLKDLG